MAKTISFTVQLKNAISGAAKDASKSIKELMGSLNEVSAAVTAANQGLELFGKGFDLIGDAIGGTLDIMGDLLDRFEQFQDVAQVFQMKDAIGGEKILNQMLHDLEEVGISVEDATFIAKKLGREFDPASAKELSRVVADVRNNLHLTSQETHGLTDSIVRMGARATVGLRQFRDLEKFSGTKDLFEEISKATGKSVSTVQQLLKKNALPTAELIKGLRQAQLDLAGTAHAGEAAAKVAATNVGDQIERMKSIIYNFGLQFAQKLFGDKDVAGKLKKLGDDLEKALNSPAVQEGLQKLADGLKAVAFWVIDKLPIALDYIGKAFKFVGDGVKWLTGGSEGANATLAALAGILGGILVVIAALGIAIVVSFLPLFTAIAAIVAAFAAIGVAIYELIHHWDDIKQAVFRAAGAIGEGLSKAWSAVTGFVDDVALAIGGGLVNAWQAVTGFIGNISDTITGGLSKAWASAAGFVDNIASSIAGGLTKAWTSVGDFFGKIGRSVSDGVTNTLTIIGDWITKMGKAGEDAIMGLVHGIERVANAPVQAVKDVATGVMNAFKSVLKISSPSVVMQEAGQDTAAGLQKGIEAGTPGVQGASKKMGESTVNSTVAGNLSPVPNATADGGLSGGLGKAAGGPAQVTVYLDMPIHIAGHDAKELNLESLSARIRDEVTKSMLIVQSRAYAQGGG